MLDGTWTHCDELAQDGWLCGMCGIERDASLELGRKLRARNSRKDRRRGRRYGPARSGVNPFR